MKRINHENTKIGKHEIFLCFRVFVISCFRDKKVFSQNVVDPPLEGKEITFKDITR